MNKTALRNFATDARRELLEKIELQARKIGITRDGVEDVDIESSDAMFINEKQWSEIEREQRNQLIARIDEIGFDQVIEETAYTWFNRFIALRFMEVNNYLPTRVRVLSSEFDDSNEPDMLKEALSLDLDIDKEYVYNLRLENKTDELFKYLIKLHCDDLNRYMPFMFEPIEDYMAILFPDGLLGSESFIQKMIDTEIIPEENWQEVEIVGWLYQYYIAEENERVIRAKKRYKKEEIPFATQLFTPEWIVRYMVQNSLGRYWIESTPEDEDLIENWEYYLKSRENEKDVIKKLTPYIDQDLSVENIKCFDPAMGSGHILVYMFDLLVEIYLKKGYLEREIPRLIIENNLYGLDIDDRAYQLASFSVVMKAMEYNRRFLRTIERDGLTLNLASIQETNSLTIEDIAYLAGSDQGENYEKMTEFLNQFKDAKAIGALIQIDRIDSTFLINRLEELEKDTTSLFDAEKRNRILPLYQQLIKQAKLMQDKYDVFVTNPPYAGRRYLTKEITDYIDQAYPDVKSDLFSSFIEYSFYATKKNGQIGFMTPYVWMFISSYEKLRKKIIDYKNISSLVQLEYSGFDGATVPICTFTLRNYNSGTTGEYIRLSDFKGAANQPIKTRNAVVDPRKPYRYTFEQENYNQIPGSPIAYWTTKNYVRNFAFDNVKDFYSVKSGIMSGRDPVHLKLWYEVNNDIIKFDCNTHKDMNDYSWFPINSGGEFRKYYGNNEYIINLKNDGERIRRLSNNYRLRDKKWYFQKGITWSRVSSSRIGFRKVKKGTLFGDAGPLIVIPDKRERYYLLGFLASKLSNGYLKFINPTLNYQIRDIEALPIIIDKQNEVIECVDKNVTISKFDWNSFETSWDFERHPFLKFPADRVQSSYEQWAKFAEDQFYQLKENEEKLNEIFIDIYGLQEELTPEIEEKDVTVRKAELERDVKSFISYAVGNMLGRYSLDEDALVYAGGDFDPLKYETFKADEDNIIPIVEYNFFDDDITNRFIEFVEVTYGKETLEDNLQFIAEAIGKRKSETAREAITRYFLNNFFKDHSQTYKRHPIYWLFTSGRQKAFNCLIYMHRYDKTTLSRIRTDYLHDVQTRYETMEQDLQQVINSDAPAREVREAKKKLTSVERKIEELKKYDEKLRHLADMQIEIDLDDGVKENYKKFEDLLVRI